MKVAVVHYHLNRGGVTQVIANHLRALNETAQANQPLEVALLFGGRHEGWDEGLPQELPYLVIRRCELPTLDYDQGHPAPEVLARQLESTLSRIGFHEHETIVHVHNHALGKNVSLPGALARLVLHGFRCLLQIHDFAEDFRPDNYRRLAEALAADDPRQLPRVLYPQSPSIHYAVLNRRDYQLLKNAGFDPQRLHRLPNPLSPIGSLPPKAAARNRLEGHFAVAAGKRLLLYPVRGIRRKNVGETVLWAALAGNRATLAITLPPMNPAESARYRAWQGLSRKLDLPIVFDVGGPEGLSFLENLAAADAIVTTSVAEGFGMVFLEAWLAGRPLVGRDLPEITADFVRSGLRLDGLSPRLAVPVDWLGTKPVRGAIERAYAQVRRDYRLPPSPKEETEPRIESLISDGLVDFAVLSNHLQEKTIELVHRDAGRGAELLRLNRPVEQALGGAAPDQATLAHNAEVVRTVYSLAAIGGRLRDLYRRVLDSPSGGPLEPPAHGAYLLHALLDIRRIHPIRLQS